MQKLLTISQVARSNGFNTKDARRILAEAGIKPSYMTIGNSKTVHELYGEDARKYLADYRAKLDAKRATKRATLPKAAPAKEAPATQGLSVDLQAALLKLTDEIAKLQASNAQIANELRRIAEQYVPPPKQWGPPTLIQPNPAPVPMWPLAPTVICGQQNQAQAQAQAYASDNPEMVALVEAALASDD